MATPTEFFNATLPEEIPIPDWTHLHIPQLPTLKLRWDEIYIDDALNTSKVEAHTPAEIQRIKLSFAEKVDIKEYPPAVRYRGGDREPWELVYGFGREEALRELDTEGWFFTHLDGSDDAIGDVQAQENEKLPKRVNEEIDLVRCLTLKVLKGHIERKEDAVREKFKLIYPNRSKEVRNRVVKKVLAALGVESPFKIYTSTTHIKNWIKNNSSEEYNQNIQKETIKWAIYDILKNPLPEFKEFIQLHFKLKKDEIIAQLKKWDGDENIKDEIINLLHKY